MGVLDNINILCCVIYMYENDTRKYVAPSCYCLDAITDHCSQKSMKKKESIHGIYKISYD